jgi:hypothetical protein
MTAEQISNALSYLPAILIFLGTLLVYAFYALYAVAGLVLAIDYGLDRMHRLMRRVR